MNSSANGQLEKCEKCGQSLVPLPVPHVRRPCSECGLPVHLVEPGKDGGLVVREGDRFVFPLDFITLSLDRKKVTSEFTRTGMNWFIRGLIFSGMLNTPEGLDALLEQYKEQANTVLEN